jgi:hypothetical protein
MLLVFDAFKEKLKRTFKVSFVIILVIHDVKVEKVLFDERVFIL